jgi:hypothetical protein
MAIQPLSNQIPAPPLPQGGNPAAWSWPAQAPFQDQDAFGAYLLTLSATSLAVMARSGYPLGGALPAAGLDSPGAAAAREAARLAAGPGDREADDATLALGPAPVADGAAEEAAAAVNRPVPEAGEAPGDGGAGQADAAQARRLAAQAAARTPNPAGGVPPLPEPREDLAGGPWNLATDATAKYMGGGLLAQQAGAGDLARAAAAYQSVMNDIPGVNGVQPSPGLAAHAGNTTPRGQRFPQSAGSQALRVPALNPTEATAVDLLG